MSNHEENPSNNAANGSNDSQSADQLLKATVDREAVVSFIEGMVQAMGSAALTAGGAPNSSRQQNQNQYTAQQEPSSRYQSKNVAAIMHKVERANKYPDVAKQLPEDELVLEWLSKAACKQKEYFGEFELAEALTSFFASRRYFELAIKSAQKALAMTKLHKRDDEETLSELYWVLADLNAAMDRMPQAIENMELCLSIIEPGADENHPTYKELTSQLNQTRERSLGLVTA